MGDYRPRVSIGLPVFNGEDYLREALVSLLAQTYGNYELIISDNASTDNTQDLCEKFAAQDKRICYHRNPINIGATQNWYRTLELSSGEYYLGVAHDDLYHPEFLSNCVAVLDQNKSAVVSYTKTKVIDEFGNFVRDLDIFIDTSSPYPHQRLYNVIGTDYLCIQLFGLMRTNTFRRTKVYSGYYGCDRNTLAELTLLGQIYEIPDYLFFHRLHPKALGAAKNSSRSLQELRTWDPGTNWQLRYPTILRFRNYFEAVSRVPLSTSERLKCYWVLIRLIGEKSLSRLKLNITKTA